MTIHKKIFVNDKLSTLCVNHNDKEFVILASIAKHTKAYNYDIENLDGYITYEGICLDKDVKTLYLDKAFIRVALSRILSKLENPIWIRKFPNLILKSNVETKNGKVGFQFRTKRIVFEQE